MHKPKAISIAAAIGAISERHYFNESNRLAFFFAAISRSCFAPSRLSFAGFSLRWRHSFVPLMLSFAFRSAIRLRHAASQSHLLASLVALLWDLPWLRRIRTYWPARTFLARLIDSYVYVRRTRTIRTYPSMTFDYGRVRATTCLPPRFARPQDPAPYVYVRLAMVTPAYSHKPPTGAYAHIWVTMAST